MNCESLNCVLQRFDFATEKNIEYFKDSPTQAANYCQLQATWNKPVLRRVAPYIHEGNSAMILGSFYGITDYALSDLCSSVCGVDVKNHFPKWMMHESVDFHQTDLDSSMWTLPDGQFDVVFMVEVLEHLLWSPVPLLMKLANTTRYLFITTPDDKEWPKIENSPYTRYDHFRNIPQAFEGCKGNPRPMFHCKQYTEVEFVELLTFCHFRITEFCRVGEGGHQMLLIAESRKYQP